MILHTPKILIVDDKSANLYALEKLLRKLKLEVVSTTSPLEALGLAAEHTFCMAIVDIQMPEIDGYELVELLRGNELTAQLPIIFVSAIYSDEHHHQRGYDAGAVDFLTKPFIPEILLSKVKVFLDLYNQRQQLNILVHQLNTANEEITQFNRELEDKVRTRTIELEQAYAHLELLDRNKSDFIQIISHELRTPLTLIQGYSHMLRKSPLIQEDAAMGQRMNGIVSGATRLHEIVNSMLELVKIDSRSLKLNMQWVNLALILDPLMHSLVVPLTERNLTIELEGLEKLSTIEADSASLIKMFNHLVLNAIKYTPDGGEIRIYGQCLESETCEGRFIEVVIADTGIGIAPDVHELIFAKFYRTGEVALHSSGRTKFKGGGPGLGLAIAKGIVEAHNGRIWVESSGYDEETCPGSQFHIILPIHQENPLLESALESLRPISCGSGDQDCKPKPVHT